MSAAIDHLAADLIASGVLVVEDGNHGEYRPRSDEFETTGVAFIRAADIVGGRIDFPGASRINDAAMRRIRKGKGRPLDVLLSHKGTVGKVAMAPYDSPPFVCSPQTTFWRSVDHGRLDPRYLSIFLRSSDFARQLDARKGETDMAAYVSLSEQRKLSLALPPIEEQREIAATLGALDDKIDSNRRLIAGAMTILDLQAEWAAQRLDRCALRHLVTSVKEPIDVRTLGDDMVEHYSLPAFDARGEPDRAPASNIMSNKLRVPDGCVLLSRLNPKTNRTWLAHPMDPTRAVASTEWLVAVPAPGLRLGAIWLALRDEDFLATLVRRASGTSGSHQRVRPADLLDIDTMDARQLPPAITAEAQELLQLGHQRRIEIARLQTLRDALLPELLSGRLRVPEAREAVADAVG